MTQIPTQRTPNERLDSIIRAALEERIANAEPPAHIRDTLLARASDAQAGRRKLRYRLPSFHLPDHLRPLTNTLRAYYNGAGYYRTDLDLGLAFANIASPFLARVNVVGDGV